MKKIMFILILIFAITLTGCTRIEDEPQGCQEGEMLIGEDCLVLSTPEIQLYNSINNSKIFAGYEMDVTISNELEMVELGIMVDHNVTTMNIGTERTITYTSNEGICDVVEVYLGTEATYTEDCNESEKYSFFRELDYTWFVLESGKYNLQDDYYDNVEELFGGFLEDSEIIEFQTSVQSGYISEITLVIEINSVEYSIEMIISNPAFIVFTQETGGE